MFVTPGVMVDGKLVTNNLVDINLGIRILLGSSYYEDWEERRCSLKTRSSRQPGRQAPSVEPNHHPRPQKRDFNGNYTWVMSPRWYRQADRELSGAGYRRGARSRGFGQPRLSDWWISATSKPQATA